MKKNKDYEIEYIPLYKASKYRSDGWEIIYLECHHSRYSVLAQRPKARCNSDEKDRGDGS